MAAPAGDFSHTSPSWAPTRQVPVTSRKASSMSRVLKPPLHLVVVPKEAGNASTDADHVDPNQWQLTGDGKLAGDLQHLAGHLNCIRAAEDNG
jgi:hypothetical protein